MSNNNWLLPLFIFRANLSYVRSPPCLPPSGSPLPESRINLPPFALSCAPFPRLDLLFSCTCGLFGTLFCTSQNANRSAFMLLRTLSRKPPGVGVGDQVKINTPKIFNVNSRRIDPCEKRSSGQDGRPESGSADEGSLLAALLRNVAVVPAHKCFVLRTYQNCACNHRIMNTSGTKDLKLPGMNTYQKQWVGVESYCYVRRESR